MTAQSTPKTAEGSPLIRPIESIIAPLACAAIAVCFAATLLMRVAG